MAAEQLESLEQSQRVRVEMQAGPVGKRVKIRVENYDDRLGWYLSGSLTLPLNQLPLLEQAVEEMRSAGARDDTPAAIIPFPGLAD